MIQIVINGKFRIAEAGQTLLDVAKVCGEQIPSLCGLNRSGEKIACDLCVVEVEVEGEGNRRACELKVYEGLNVNPPIVKRLLHIAVMH